MANTDYDVINQYDMVPAFAGMKADSMFDHVETLAAQNSIGFGVLVGFDGTGAVIPVGSVPAGIALHDPIYANRMISPFVAGATVISAAYLQYDAVSVLRRGKAWAVAGGTCTDGAVAKYTAATGIFSDAGAVTLPNAVFRSKDYSWPGILPGDATQRVVLVELHSPMT